MTIGGIADNSDSGDDNATGQAYCSGARRRARFATLEVCADLRRAREGLPEGLEIVGGEPTFEEQEDGDSALIVGEGTYVKVCLPPMSPWMLEDDGRIHRYSLLMALRIDRLPAAAIPIFNGGMPPSPGEAGVDHVYLYKNGGVGALGQQGVRDAAVRAERWAWVVVTRSGNELLTYVNGRLCAKVDVTVKQPKAADEKGAKKKASGARGERETHTAADDHADDADGADKHTAKPERLPERLCIDPQHLALFATSEGADSGGGEGMPGLALRYVQLSMELWDPERVRQVVEQLRAADEEAALEAEAETARSQQLCLQPCAAHARSRATPHAHTHAPRTYPPMLLAHACNPRRTLSVHMLPAGTRPSREPPSRMPPLRTYSSERCPPFPHPTFLARMPPHAGCTRSRRPSGCTRRLRRSLATPSLLALASSAARCTCRLKWSC